MSVRWRKLIRDKSIDKLQVVWAVSTDYCHGGYYKRLNHYPIRRLVFILGSSLNPRNFTLLNSYLTHRNVMWNHVHIVFVSRECFSVLHHYLTNAPVNSDFSVDQPTLSCLSWSRNETNTARIRICKFTCSYLVNGLNIDVVPLSGNGASRSRQATRDINLGGNHKSACYHSFESVASGYRSTIIAAYSVKSL